MDSTIIVALIGGLCASIPSVIATVTSNNKSRALMEYKIEQLDKKVEKHNKVIERTYKLEKEVELIGQEIEFHHGSHKHHE